MIPVYLYTIDGVNDFYLSPHFNLSEFECPCCHRVILLRPIFEVLLSVRDDFGNPIYVNSGYRCLLHNIAVGGRLDSKHQYGGALDVSPRKPSDLPLVLSSIERHSKVVEAVPEFKKGYIHFELI